MRKYFFVGLLLVVMAIALTVAVVYEDADAFPTGWTDANCGGCHAGDTVLVAPAAHTVAAHSSVYPSNCAACHTTAPAIDADNCAAAGCHNSRDAIAAAHAAVQGATCESTGCHPTAATTTTVPGETTTTLTGQTTTTVGQTTTTLGVTTTTLGVTTTTVPTVTDPVDDDRVVTG
jgi:hypothetical protein